MRTVWSRGRQCLQYMHACVHACPHEFLRVWLCLQGLSEAVRQRVGQWQLTAPCKARLLLPTVNDMIAVEQLRVSTQSALLELSSLPAGSTVRLYSGQLWRPAWLAACQAIAAVEPSLAHITVLPVSFPYEQLAIQELCAPDYPLPYGLLHKLPASDVVGPAYPHPWPWQSLRTGRVVLYRVCELPPVPDGMRPELWASEVFVEPDCKVRGLGHMYRHCGTGIVVVIAGIQTQSQQGGLLGVDWQHNMP